MKLMKQTLDAINILVYCYQCGDKLVKVSAIATNLGLTKQMTLKIANILSRAGLVETARGPHGGIKLCQETKDARLGFIVRTLEAKPTVYQATQSSDNIEVYIDEAFEAFLEVLDQHSLNDIAEKRQLGTNQKTSNKSNKPLKKAQNLNIDHLLLI